MKNELIRELSRPIESEILTTLDIRDALVDISQTLREFLKFLKEREDNRNKEK